MSNFSDHTCERKSRHYWTACLYVCVFRLRIELNISPGLLCCCGSVWEEKRTRVRERAAVAMVSRGWLARRILSQKEEGYLLGACGGGGGPSRCPSLSPSNRPPHHLTLPSPPSLTQWLTPLFLCLFFCPSHLVLVTHSATTRCRFTGKQKQKNSEEGDRISQTWEGEIGRRLVKVWNSHTVSFLLSFLHSPSPFLPSAALAALCYVICLLPLSSESPSSPVTPVSHYLYCFLSNHRIDQQHHSQCFCCLGLITLMQGLLAAVLKGWVGDLEEGEGGVTLLPSY